MSYTPQTNREWWSQRWLELLDSYRFKKRLERGRIYAREGNVLSIEFQGAKVLAKVQGSEPEPYRVSLSLDQFDSEQWDFVIETMLQKSIYAAKLLAGEMPQNIEEVFTQNGLSLFPFTLGDVHSRCTCPDKANPCKHIAAVYYQLGDRFSEDPFVLFQLRGRDKEKIIQDLRKLRYQQLHPETVPSDGETGTITDNHTDETPNIEVKQHPKIAIDLHKYWEYNEPLEPSLVVISPSTGETILDFLGTIPLARDEEKIASLSTSDVVMRYLENIYKDVSQKAFLSAMNIGND